MTIIKSRNKTFRRAGLDFHRDGVEVDLDKLSKARRAAIENEPQLVVVEETKPAKGKTNSKPDGKADGKSDGKAGKD